MEGLYQSLETVFYCGQIGIAMAILKRDKYCAEGIF